MATDIKQVPSLAVPTWQQMEADLLECKAEAIDAAIMGAQRLQGMFNTNELKTIVSAFLDLMQIEQENLRNAADN